VLFAQGLLLGLSIAAPIGPVNLEMIRRGLRGGFTPAFLVGCGSTAADLVYVSLVYLGVAPLVERPALRIVLGAAAALVLGWLGRGALREAWRGGREPAGEERAPAAEGRGALAAGFFITLSNPMTIVFYLSLFGGAVAALHEAPRESHLLFVGAVITGCLLWTAFLASALGWGKDRVGPGWRRGIAGVSGLVLIGFSFRFLADAVREAWSS
jgi:threonine/homoserine/homoserine lactone efflux protein